MWFLYRFYQLNKNRCRCKWDVTIDYLTRAIFEKQLTALHVVRIIIFLNCTGLFCWQKCGPRPKLFPRLDIFSTLVDHVILIHCRKSFIPDNRMKINMAKHKRLHKITFPRHRKHLHSSSVLKITLETAKHFPQQPIMTQNPPCNTLATVQTSNIERPDPSVTHHYVYQGENSAIFRRKIVVCNKNIS